MTKYILWHTLTQPVMTVLPKITIAWLCWDVLLLLGGVLLALYVKHRAGYWLASVQWLLRGPQVLAENYVS